MKTRLSISLILLIYSPFWAQAGGSPPAWLSQPLKEDKTYFYYVGRSTSNESESEAFKEATKQAQGLAIRENFGVLTEFEVSSYESLGEVNLVKRTVEKSPTVNLVGFEQIDSYQMRENGGTNLWLLFRYKKSEARKERLRLKRGDPVKEAAFSEMGKIAGQNQTFLEIQTKPSGAEIYIDGVRWGISPMRLNGIMEVGKHKIFLTHPKFEDVKEDLILVAGKKITMKKVLKKATATLSINSDPYEAEIFINGVPIGKTPVKNKKVWAEEKITIEARHERAENVSQTLTLGKGESKSIDMVLPLKPGWFMHSGIPLKAIMEINGAEVSLRNFQKHKISAGEHTVRIYIDDHYEYIRDFDIKGGETYKLEPVGFAEMEWIKPPEREIAKAPEELVQTEALNMQQLDSYYESSTEWAFGYWSVPLSYSGETFDSDVAQSTFGAGLGYEFRILPIASLKASGEYLMGLGYDEGVDYNTIEYDCSGVGGYLGLQFFINPGNPDAEMYLAYEVGGVRYKFEDPAGIEEDFTVSQKYTGVRLGLMQPDNGWEASLVYRTYKSEILEPYAALGFQFGFLFGK